MKLGAIIAAGVFGATTACVLAQAPEYTGSGAELCAKFVRGDARETELAWEWARGFMSSMNATLSVEHHPPRNIVGDPDQQVGLLRTYCIAHPQENYIQAVMNLFASRPECGGETSC
jgi:hypothetical protein